MGSLGTGFFSATLFEAATEVVVGLKIEPTAGRFGKKLETLS